MRNARQLISLFRPEEYLINLIVHRKDRKFFGEVQIIGTVAKDTQTIILHAKDLHIPGAQIDGHEARVNCHDDKVTLTVNHLLKSGPHHISIVFTGRIKESLHGLYVCHYMHNGVTRELLCTQFESHYAREVFPCIDEPAAKATFELHITTEGNVSVLSNTAVVRESINDGESHTEFAKTPKMSTYLLAFVIGELDYVETISKAGVRVRGYAVAGQSERMRFAIDCAANSFDFYDDYFGTPYPLGKCDIIAVPDFSSLAQENWGCITGRESAFLTDESQTSINNRRRLIQVVVHEVAHQWFGNLVTMKWWDDLWLNEGFANFMEGYVGARLYPEFDLDTDLLVQNTAVAQHFDSRASTHPIQLKIDYPQEITTAFDEISYEKGASVLAMLQSYLGEEVFGQGLRQYIATYRFGSATTEDLWETMSKTSGENVKEFMDAWIQEPGFPLVSINLVKNVCLISQKRFFANPKKHATDDTIWHIPLAANREEFPQQMSGSVLRVNLLDETDKVLEINHNYNGYYLTFYPPNLRERLGKAIEGGDASIKDRLGIIHEVFEIARAGYMKTTEALQFLEYYRNEDDANVWQGIASQLRTIRLMVDLEDSIQPFDTFVASLVEPLYKRLGLQPSTIEPVHTRVLRQTIIGMACDARAPYAIKAVQELYTRSTSRESIPPDLRYIVYATAVQFGPQSVFDDLLYRFITSDFVGERLDLLVGLCATTSHSSQIQLLDYIRHRARVQDLTHWLTYLFANKSSRYVAWEWMKNNFRWMATVYDGDLQYSYLPTYAAHVFSRKKELDDYLGFFNPLRKDPYLTRSIDQQSEAIDTRVQWRVRDYDEIARFFTDVS